jgi:kynureninase
MNFEYSEDFAKKQDAADELKSFREKFYFPQLEGKDVVYFTGNSLGLQPKTVQDYVLKVTFMPVNPGFPITNNSVPSWRKLRGLCLKKWWP